MQASPKLSANAATHRLSISSMEPSAPNNTSRKLLILPSRGHRATRITDLFAYLPNAEATASTGTDALEASQSKPVPSIAERPQRVLRAQRTPALRLTSPQNKSK